MHDIYDPPPAPLALDAPEPVPLFWTRGDVTCLAVFIVLLALASTMAWSFEPTVAVMVALGGALVILESWFTALGYLHLRPSGTLTGRWMIFLGALLPWVIGLTVAAALMMGLFLAWDWLG